MGNVPATTSTSTTTQMALGGPQLHLPHLPHSQSEPSKLCQLRARYQQRQLADKEQRLLQLYAEQRAQQERAFQRSYHPNNSAGSSSSTASQSSQGSQPCGRVRQLFEVRRQAGRDGRDRGVPLAPLERRTRALATRSSSNVNLSQTYHFGQAAPKGRAGQSRGHSLDRGFSRRQGEWAAYSHHRQHPDYRSDSSESDRDSPPPYARTFGAFDSRMQEDIRLLNRLPNVGGQLPSQAVISAMAPPGRLSAAPPARRPPGPAASNENAPPPARAAGPGLASRLPGPAQARKTAAPASGAAAAAFRHHDPDASSSSREAPALAPASVQPAKPAARANGVSRTTPTSKVQTSPLRMSGTAGMAGSRPAAAQAGRGRVAAATTARPEPRQDDGLVACPVCTRRFLPDRVAKHQEICNKSTHKKRKVFDPVAARVKGTEAEKYVRRVKNAPEPKVMKNSNWRRKHEDFIQTIRAAKQVQSHIASGGKLSDLPPPPPSDYSDYIPCPHCGRKFNQTAADRHIPKCATMLHNKPKPGGTSKPSVGRGSTSRR